MMQITLFHILFNKCNSYIPCMLNQTAYIKSPQHSQWTDNTVKYVTYKWKFYFHPCFWG
jgi:hypothetical protein